MGRNRQDRAARNRPAWLARLRRQPGFRTAAIAFVLTVVLGVGGTAAYAFWGARSTASFTVTADVPAPAPTPEEPALPPGPVLIANPFSLPALPTTITALTCRDLGNGVVRINWASDGGSVRVTVVEPNGQRREKPLAGGTGSVDHSFPVGTSTIKAVPRAASGEAGDPSYVTVTRVSGRAITCSGRSAVSDRDAVPAVTNLQCRRLDRGDGYYTDWQFTWDRPAGSQEYRVTVRSDLRGDSTVTSGNSVTIRAPRISVRDFAYLVRVQALSGTDAGVAATSGFGMNNWAFEWRCGR